MKVAAVGARSTPRPHNVPDLVQRHAVHVLFLLVLLFSVTAACSSGSIDRPETDGMTDNATLIDATLAGDIDAVSKILDSDVDLEAEDDAGRTALNHAVRTGNVAIASALISAGADVNHKDDTIQSPYLLATSELPEDTGLQILELTFAAGADVHSLDSFRGTGLIRAADRGHVEIVRRLLETDIEIDHINNLGWTALLEAILLGGGDEAHTDVVRVLVDAGADVNLADANGVSPLAHAQARDYAEMIAILIRAGATEGP